MTMLLINKEEALVLAKILHQHSNEQYSNGSDDEQLSPFQETLRELQLRVNDFLTGDGEDEEEDEDEEAADEGDDEEESDEEDDDSDDEATDDADSDFD